jgi:hypothetical protein
MWALIPETIGKDLEAVDELLRTEVSHPTFTLAKKPFEQSLIDSPTPPQPWFIPKSAEFRKKGRGKDTEQAIREGRYQAPVLKEIEEEENEKKMDTSMHEHAR